MSMPTMDTHGYEQVWLVFTEESDIADKRLGFVMPWARHRILYSLVDISPIEGYDNSCYAIAQQEEAMLYIHRDSFPTAWILPMV